MRVDELLVARGIADDLALARALVMTGKVMVTEPNRGERKIEKSGTSVLAASSVRVAGDQRRFVSRAGEKLEAALDAFELDVDGWTCIDLGLSTGGFTDCLLSRGAALVHGVDVAHGIVDWRIRSDARVHLHERTDARTVTPGTFGVPADLVTIDVSLLSATEVVPASFALLKPTGHLLVLIKPQYEVSRSALKDGIVEDEADQQAAVERVTQTAIAEGFRLVAVVPSSVRGTKGNQEYVAHFEVAV